MDPQIAIQLLLTLAKISGTILAILMAVIIFAIRDEDMARLILLGKPLGYWPLIALSVTCIFLVAGIVAPLLSIVRLNPEEPVSDASIMGMLALFIGSFVAMFFLFGALLSDKRNFLKEQDKS